MVHSLKRIVQSVTFAGLVFLCPRVLKADAGCPDIAGEYYSGAYTFVFHQRGCEIRSVYFIGGFRHELTATLRGTSGRGEIMRTNFTNHCTTRLRIHAQVQGEDKLEIYTEGSDGRCDLPPGYTEYAMLTRY